MQVTELKPDRTPVARRLRNDVHPTDHETAFGCPRNFLTNRFVYVVISPRARGLSVGVNMNPDKHCDFDCVYCEVNRELPAREARLDVAVMAEELQQTLRLVQTGAISAQPTFQTVPAELLHLRHVTLSGDGEPTLCPNFPEAVEAVTHLRALGKVPTFKVVLITNATGLELPQAQRGLSCLTPQDEIWAKLDAGTQDYMNLVNRPGVPLQRVLDNILLVSRKRPVIIQSLFSLIRGLEPSAAEIEQYALRLKDLVAKGAQISHVQIYSATRPSARSECDHLPLKTLSGIARTVREIAGLKAEVF